jgi:hypothetical protein
MNFVFYKMRVTYAQEQKALASQKYSDPILDFIALKLKFCNDLYFLKKKYRTENVRVVMHTFSSEALCKPANADNQSRHNVTFAIAV